MADVRQELRTVDLLEREAPLARLNEIFGRVRQGARGACVLVHGEAGIGKTSVVQSFVGSLPPGAATTLVAGCEHLYTPRPLGPLADLADRFPPSVTASLHEGRSWGGLFPRLLGHLRDAGACTVLVIEDMHWADAATLDFVRYVGRRLHDIATLLLLTYRSDELETDHPLRHVLGELPGATTTRLAIGRLSPEAVATLAARSGRSPRGLYEATLGNPFYLTELLADEPGQGVPPSVADAVLARLALLPPAARAVAELVSVSPSQIDSTLLKVIAPGCCDEVDRCVRKGLLVVQGAAIGFRHELAREAVLQAIDPQRRLALHEAVFTALRGQGDASLARQVHHAEGAALGDAVASLAPRAARHAAGSGAHQEAARLYALALQYGKGMAPPERAGMLEAFGLESTMTGQYRQAIRGLEEALAIHLSLGDRRREGITRRWLARLHGWSDSIVVAFEQARAAIAALEALPRDAELAMAYATRAHLHLVGEQLDEVRQWGSKAIALAEGLAKGLAETAALSQALNTVACARLRFGDDLPAWEMLERSLELALAQSLEPEAALAFNNLQLMSLVNRRFAQAATHAERGIAYCEARGLDVFTVRMRIRRAFGWLQTCRWDLADADLSEVREYLIASPMEQATCGFVQGLLELRRGATGAAQRLGATCAAMQELGVRIWFMSIAGAAAEAAWLAGDNQAVQAAVLPTFERVVALGDPWRIGELAAWLVRAGRPVDAKLPSLHPAHALEIAGKRREAAAAWRALGCPYEAGLALAGSDDEASLREALQRFEQLGATPAAEVLRRRLHSAGARGVARGPQPRTLGDPLGLTAREREVFECLLRGQSNAAIAGGLHRSSRTVEHHVAAVFVKVGVSTRAELLARFAGLGAASSGK